LIVTTELSAEEITPEVLSLARRLMNHPGILKTEAQVQAQVQRAASRPKPTVHVCPYCQAQGVPIQVGELQFTRRRDDCCQQAIFDAARVALYCCTNPKNPEDASLQQARFYAVLKAQLMDPQLQRELATHEYLRAGG